MEWTIDHCCLVFMVLPHTYPRPDPTVCCVLWVVVVVVRRRHAVTVDAVAAALHMGMNDNCIHLLLSLCPLPLFGFWIGFGQRCSRTNFKVNPKPIEMHSSVDKV